MVYSPLVRYHAYMIASITGTVRALQQSSLVVDVHGIGYRIHCTQRFIEASGCGDEVSLHTHLVVREDALELFGFPLFDELELFQLLIGVSGIGPRSALGIVGLDTVGKLAHAIAESDVEYLTKVSGVGKKSAEKIVLELREKVTKLAITDPTSNTNTDRDVLEALQALGYRADDAREALRSLPRDITEQGTRIKAALRLLSRP